MVNISSNQRYRMSLCSLWKRNVGLTVDDSLMRVYVAAPEPVGQYPGILFYGDIFQLGRPITLLADRLAGYGYVVAAPEIFHRTEPIGTAIEPGDLGLMRDSDNARRTAIAEYDADALAVLEWLRGEDSVVSEKLGTIGFCIGGHLAFRAAFQSQVKATVCCYPTGIHNGEFYLEGEKALTVFGCIRDFPSRLLILVKTTQMPNPIKSKRLIRQLLKSTVNLNKILLLNRFE